MINFTLYHTINIDIKILINVENPINNPDSNVIFVDKSLPTYIL